MNAIFAAPQRLAGGFTCKFRSTFTLIEMLVVIAIIGILASLLMPALTKARDAARKVTCINNISQITQSQHMYAADNNGFMIYSGFKLGAGDTWVMAMMGGFHNPHQQYLPRYTSGSGVESVFVCPLTEPAVYVNSARTYGMYAGWARMTDYNAKVPTQGNFMWQDPTQAGACVFYRLQSFKQPSRFVLFADTQTASTGSLMSKNGMPLWYFFSYGKAEDSAVALLHDGFAVSGFVDGHVASLDENGLAQTGTNIVAYVYNGVMYAP